MSSDYRIIVVSSDPNTGPLMADAITAGAMGSCEFFETGEAALSALVQAGYGPATAVVVDASVGDLSPLNLVGSIAARRPDVGIVCVVSALDEDVRNRAMLAGARAVIDRSRLQVDLLPAVVRVRVGHSARPAAPPSPTSSSLARGTGKVVTFAGAKGGCGRTTLSALYAIAAQRAGLMTALVDFDLQFGDLSFVFDCAPQKTLVDLLEALSEDDVRVEEYAHELQTGLHLFTPSPQPERAEIVAPRVGHVLRRLSEHYQVIVVNTGAFWTLFHAETLEASDRIQMVLSQRPAAVRASVLARNLTSKLGIPEAKVDHVVNRFSSRGPVTTQDICAALRVQQVVVIPDGGDDVAGLMDAGNPYGVFESKNQVGRAITRTFEDVASRTGLAMPRTESFASGSAKRKGWF